jgi:hypothetical protein
MLGRRPNDSRWVNHRATVKHRSIKDQGQLTPLQEPGRRICYYIGGDDPKAKTWYCAEVRKILADRFGVNYCTTATPIKIPGFVLMQKEKRVKEANFLRTWCLDRGADGVTNDVTTSHQSRKDETPMVGKGTIRRYRQAHTRTRCR